jgi:hypothetical protein
MLKESELEAKKMELTMLIALTNPSISDPNKHREWHKAIKGVWSKYIALMLNVEIPEQTQEELEMMEYYETVVKKAKLRLVKTGNKGGIGLEGLDQLFPHLKK